ncbi:MAG: ferredoxin [Deltaproteobacteria bacterium CG23_combo_of_CG06-09_8_20_14_all_51_20]|nr:ferredoxin [bacterium]OIP43098.1 MAG: hypothetical protein AUK25_02175 [Desulfobacteraceae bacterium CG2_30_51_40]PIP47203.1 MAG: ferredoxin [Deltaproteobacteria bacterium CG23_combo_of_CG06-09_8_20_14_all_51_20]PIY26040.1 MAG: ferredoxin [Deltaproteobacteria bacterium CG_4_10_14_3_um_filter_51_14]PJB36450.1 MAG: ferredoxin [Deltaproteobacteria bacterium CG_4_9_14_3_um_filter_51_14]
MPQDLSEHKIPVVDMGDCTRCESCIEVCLSVFSLNPETGWVEVADMEAYPVSKVEEAMVLCPGKCISWEER